LLLFGEFLTFVLHAANPIDLLSSFSMHFTASQISQMIGGSIEGSPDAQVNSFGKIEEATIGQLSFLANPKYEEFLYLTSASVVIINESLELKRPVTPTLIRVPDAYSSFASLLEKYQQLKTQMLSGIQQPAHIHESAKLGEQVFVGAFTFIGEKAQIGPGSKIFPNCHIGNNVRIGENCILHPGVKIYQDCIIGNEVVIHAGAVIGSDGFGFAPQADGTYRKVPQIGNVLIEDRVEIGANTTIDRATIGSTIIRSGVKLDNLIQIAHNVEIGKDTVIAAQAGISGSTKIGKNVMIGGQVGITGHIHVADGSKVSAQSGITKSVKAPNMVLSGTPAQDHGAYLRTMAMGRTLPEIEKRISELEEIIKHSQPHHQ